jgi:DNA-binding transcriptional MerR regulator
MPLVHEISLSSSKWDAAMTVIDRARNAEATLKWMREELEKQPADGANKDAEARKQEINERIKEVQRFIHVMQDPGK